MLFDVISKLQQKPLPERRRITLWLALGVTLCIVAVWLITFILISPASVSTDEVAPSPFRALFDGFKNSFSGIKGDVSTE